MSDDQNKPDGSLNTIAAFAANPGWRGMLLTAIILSLTGAFSAPTSRSTL